MPVGAQGTETEVAVEVVGVVVVGIEVDGVVVVGVEVDGVVVVGVSVELFPLLDRLQQSPSGLSQVFALHSIQTSVQPVSLE